MAPEVIQHNPYDHRVDVYSFGIVLWELCTSEVRGKPLEAPKNRIAPQTKKVPQQNLSASVMLPTLGDSPRETQSMSTPLKPPPLS